MLKDFLDRPDFSYEVSASELCYDFDRNYLLNDLKNEAYSDTVS